MLSTGPVPRVMCYTAAQVWTLSLVCGEGYALIRAAVSGGGWNLGL